MESKKFSKVQFLQSNGLMQRLYNYETNEFERSWPLHLKSYFTLLVKVSFPLKLVVSVFYDRDDRAQIFIGNIYNYLADDPRFFIAFAGVGVDIFHYSFCYTYLYFLAASCVRVRFDQFCVYSSGGGFKLAVLDSYNFQPCEHSKRLPSVPGLDENV